MNETFRPQRSTRKAVAITRGATTEPIRIKVGAETMVTASITNVAIYALEVGKPASEVSQACGLMIAADV
jgi:molybdopterin-binding protein